MLPGLRALARAGRADGSRTRERADGSGTRGRADGARPSRAGHSRSDPAPPLLAGDGDERPRREDAEQGALGDAGLIAVLGAVAAHYPAEIGRRVAGVGDGSYLVLLDRVRRTPRGAVPDGRVLELEVTADLPVYDHSPGEPAYAKAGGGAWAPILEKAFAGVEQTWTARRRAQQAAADGSGRQVSGYLRLDQGFGLLDCAEALAQLTGGRAVVRRSPAEPGRLLRRLCRHLGAGQPVIVVSRRPAWPGEILPDRLIAGHAYEVIAAGSDVITLRNPWGFAHPRPLRPGTFDAALGRRYVTLARRSRRHRLHPPGLWKVPGG